jgi:hypothetical protein
MKDLAELQQAITDAACRDGATIAEFNESVNAVGFHVHTWIWITSKVGVDNFEIGWSKIGSSWCVVIRKHAQERQPAANASCEQKRIIVRNLDRLRDAMKAEATRIIKA